MIKSNKQSEIKKIAKDFTDLSFKKWVRKDSSIGIYEKEEIIEDVLKKLKEEHKKDAFSTIQTFIREVESIYLKEYKGLIGETFVTSVFKAFLSFYDYKADASDKDLFIYLIDLKKKYKEDLQSIYNINYFISTVYNLPCPYEDWTMDFEDEKYFEENIKLFNFVEPYITNKEQ